jgi:DNA-binding beta-propeller fold protein YncE
MTRKAALSTLLLLAAPALGGEAPPARSGRASFARKPTASRAGDAVKIAFAASRETDATVYVENAAGEVVRHLAAGLLGENAPAPLKAGSLEQSIPWDGKDDAGRPARGGPFRARVRLGMAAKFDRIIGWEPQMLFLVAGLAVSADGEVFLIERGGNYIGGDFGVRVLDRDGKYLRTIAPYPASLPYEKVRGFGPHAFPEKHGMPLFHNGHGQSMHPFTAAIQPHNPAVLPDGRLVFCSGTGSGHEQNPPFHLLALNPDGSCPQTGFVGPLVRRGFGFVGGDGGSSGYRPWFFAAGPDGKQFYVSGLLTGDRYWKQTPAHAVFRLAWEEEKLPAAPFIGELGKPGDDGTHLRDPRGMATDGDGNLHVADRGNNRLAVFDPAGKFLGGTKIDGPEQVVVNRGTGEVFVLCFSFKQNSKGTARPVGYRIVKLSGGRNGKVLCQTQESKIGWSKARGSSWPTMALDAAAKPPRLWLGAGGSLRYFEDRGTALEPKGEVMTGKGLFAPDRAWADEARKRLYVQSRPGFVAGISAVDLESDTIAAAKVSGGVFAADSAGNLYVNSGYLKTKITRYDPEGRPLPFPATGKAEIGPFKSVWRSGFTVAPDGDIYVLHAKQAAPLSLDVWGADGKEKRKDVIPNLPDATCGVGVDAAGNVYLGINVRKPDHLYPDPCNGLFPATAWNHWRRQEQREMPWKWSYFNHYLFWWGSVFKFAPTGGRWFRSAKRGEKPAEVPAGAAAYKGAFLDADYWVQGRLWQYQGFSPCPKNRSEGGGGDDNCTCWGGRFATDAFGRCFVPDCLRFSVVVIDANANELVRFGEYGNMDSRGPGSPIPEPEIPVGWPAHVAANRDFAYLSDRMNRRVVAVRLVFADEQTCALP